MSKDQIIRIGQYYGYPQCCIDDFFETADVDIVTGCMRADYLQRRKDHNMRQEQLAQAGVNPKHLCDRSGFIPCRNHCQMVIDDKIQIKDIIVNRVCRTAFPNSEQDDKRLDKFMDLR